MPPFSGPTYTQEELLLVAGAALLLVLLVMVVARALVRRARSDADVAVKRALRERERIEMTEREQKAAREQASQLPGAERTVLEGVWRGLRDVGHAATREDVGMALGRAVTAALAPKQWMVFLPADAEAQDYVVVASSEDPGSRAWGAGARISSQTGKIGLVVRRRVTLDRRDFDAEPPIVRQQVSRTEPADFRLDLVTPIVVGDRVVAVIAVGESEASLASARTALEILAEFAAVVLRNLAARAKAERFANQDALTGLGNKSWFSAVAADATYRVRQEGGRAALVMFSIDHYAHYLQRNGHQAADKLVRGIAQVLRPLVREQDLVARWAADEYVVLMPDADLPIAWDLATRARRAVAQVEWPQGATQPGRRVTMCAAISGMPGTGETLETLVEAASQTLNEARAAGGSTTGSVLLDPAAERHAAERRAAARAAAERDAAEPEIAVQSAERLRESED